MWANQWIIFCILKKIGFHLPCRCPKTCAVTLKAAQKKKQARPRMPWRHLTHPEEKTAPTATAPQRKHGPSTTVAGDPGDRKHQLRVCAATCWWTDSEHSSICSEEPQNNTWGCKAVKNPTVRAIWVVIIFDRGDLVVARCCSVSMFSPLVRWTSHSWTVEMLHTSPSYDSWYCDFDQLLRGDLLGAWAQDQKFEWWYHFLYCSLWISFNSIVCFTVFLFLLRPNVYEIAATSTGN